MTFQFRPHKELEGQHAFLSASKYAWLRYDDEKLAETFANSMNARLGSELHDLAHNMIRLGVKAQRSTKTFNRYVNDCIGYRMSTERVLFYSQYVFGTADAITFIPAPKDSGFKFILRIFDLKNGVSPAKMDQLLIYAAIFFLEYKIRPSETEVQLRIYQNDAIEEYYPELDIILEVMDKIVASDKLLNQIQSES